MTIVRYPEYDKEKQEFFRKHKHDFEVFTSPMDKNSRYMKTYLFADNSVWYEVITTAKEFIADAVAEVRGVEIPIKQVVTLCETEYWNTDNAGTKYLYER